MIGFRTSSIRVAEGCSFRCGGGGGGRRSHSRRGCFPRGICEQRGCGTVMHRFFCNFLPLYINIYRNDDHYNNKWSCYYVVFTSAREIPKYHVSQAITSAKQINSLSRMTYHKPHEPTKNQKVKRDFLSIASRISCDKRSTKKTRIQDNSK